MARARDLKGPYEALRAQPDPHEPRHGRVLPDGRPRRPVPGRRGELVGHVSDDALRPGLGDLPYGPRGRAVPRDVGRGRVGRCRSPSGGTIERLGPVTGTPPAPRIVPVPSAWAGAKIRLLIQTLNSTHYSLAAMPAGNPKAKLVIGTASAGLVSGGKWLLCGQSRGRLCHFAMEPGRGLLVPRAGMLISAAGDRYTGEAQYISATESIQF